MIGFIRHKHDLHLFWRDVIDHNKTTTCRFVSREAVKWAQLACHKNVWEPHQKCTNVKLFSSAQYAAVRAQWQRLDSWFVRRIRLGRTHQRQSRWQHWCTWCNASVSFRASEPSSTSRYYSVWSRNYPWRWRTSHLLGSTWIYPWSPGCTQQPASSRRWWS